MLELVIAAAVEARYQRWRKANAPSVPPDTRLARRYFASQIGHEIALDIWSDW